MAKELGLVYVEWVDSLGCAENWEPLSEDVELTPARCCSVGWIYKQGDDSVLLIPHLGIGNQGHTAKHGCGDMLIPRVAITKIETLAMPEGVVIAG